jgi:hypothetical protein
MQNSTTEIMPFAQPRILSLDSQYRAPLGPSRAYDPLFLSLDEQVLLRATASAESQMKIARRATRSRGIDRAIIPTAAPYS